MEQHGTLAQKTPTTLEHVERIRKYRTFVKGIGQESGVRPQVVNLLFLFSRKLWMTWKAQRNSTISAAPEEEQSVLDFRRRQSHRSRDRMRAMTLRLLGKFFMILLPFTGLSALSQVLCLSWRRLQLRVGKNKLQFCINSTSYKYIV